MVPAQKPILGGRIVFKVYDENTLSSDELIGSIHLDLKDLIPDADNNPGRMNLKYDWKNVYGAPKGRHGDMTKLMN